MVNDILAAVAAENLSGTFLWMALLIYLAAGLVKGTLGIGFPTTAVSLMAQFTDARTAIAIVVLPMVVTNLRQVWRSRQIRWVLSQFWRLLIPMLVFIALFSQVSSIISVNSLSAMLGAVIVLYAATSLYKAVFSIPAAHDSTAQVITGVSAGVMGGMAGVWAPPILIYLSARQLAKEQFVAVTGVLLLSGSVFLLAGYWHTEVVTPGVLLVSCVLLLPAMLGMMLGEQIRYRLSANRFERLLLWFFLLMGLNLIRRALL